MGLSSHPFRITMIGIVIIMASHNIGYCFHQFVTISPLELSYCLQQIRPRPRFSALRMDGRGRNGVDLINCTLTTTMTANIRPQRPGRRRDCGYTATHRDRDGVIRCGQPPQKHFHLIHQFHFRPRDGTSIICFDFDYRNLKGVLHFFAFISHGLL